MEQLEVIEILHDRMAECYVIGSIMIDTNFTDIAIRKLGTSSSVFFTKDNQLIYEAAIKLRAEKKPTSPVMIRNKLESIGELNRAGGDDYLYKVSARIVETESSPYYCDLVLELAIRREYRKFGSEVIDMSNNRDSKLPEVSDFASRSVKGLANRSVRRQLNDDGLEDIMTTEFPERPQLIPGFLPKGLIIMAGQPKVGKSYAMLNLAIAAAQGGVMWSTFRVQEPTNTLYVAYESDYNEIKERTHQIVCGQPVPNNLFFLKMDIDDMDLRLDAEGLLRLSDYVTRRQIGLVIIDTWQRARPVDDNHKGNAYERDSDLLIPVQMMTKVLDITTILVHHTRKGIDETNPFNEISGSTGFQAISDAMMLMKKEEGNMNRLWVRGRRMADNEYHVEVDVTKPGVVHLSEVDETTQKPTPERRGILDVLADGDVMTTVDIAERIDKPETTVRRTLTRMVKDGQIEKVGRGKFQRIVGETTIEF